MIDTIKNVLRPALHRWIVSDAMFSRYMGWRRSKLKLIHIGRFGNVVVAGPFAGLRLRVEYSELPKFLGTYEFMLSPFILQLTRRRYDVILNIGCAEGYYAAGFARLMPSVKVEAFDTDSVQRLRCRANIELNALSDRITLFDRFEGERFNSFSEQRTLVVCDIEGGEIELIRPDRWRGLASMDLLIELHEDHIPDILGLFKERFHHTHELIHVRRRLIDDFAQIEKLFPNEMDQLAAIYENRFGPQTWLILLRRD